MSQKPKSPKSLTSVTSATSTSSFGFPMTSYPSVSSFVRLSHQKSGRIRPDFDSSREPSRDGSKDSPPSESSTEPTTPDPNEFKETENQNGGRRTELSHIRTNIISQLSHQLKKSADVQYSPKYTSTPQTGNPPMYKRRSVIELGNKTIPEFKAPPRFMGESSYRQTVIFILSLATYRCFPQRELVVHSQFSFILNAKSYYCRFRNHTCDAKDVEKIGNEMRNIANMQIEISEKYMHYDDCVKHFTKTKQLYTAKLV